MVNDARFRSVLHKRDVRHGLAPGDEACESDEEPERKKARIIEEPEGGEVPSLSSDQDMLFAPSDLDGTEVSGRVDEPPSRDSHAATEKSADEPPDKRQRISESMLSWTMPLQKRDLWLRNMGLMTLQS